MSKSLRTALVFSLSLLLSLCLVPSALAGAVNGAESSAALSSEQEDSAPFVTFLCDPAEALRGFSVYDATGDLCQPLTDPDTGELQYGSYQLRPGEYRYRYHDADGLYEDQEAVFSVKESVYAYYLRLNLIPVREVYSFSYTYINPAYADTVDMSDIPPVSVSTEEQVAQATAIANAMEGSLSRNTARFFQDSGIRHTSVAAAAAELKTQIMDFEETATIRLVISTKPTAADWQALSKEIFAAAIAHTGVPTEGDYLRYEYGGYNSTGSVLSSGDKYICVFNYALLHFTTAEQEAALTDEVNRVLSSLALDGKSDYEKIHAIYDYLCANVAYGGSGNLKNTAYGALIEKLCVCQGYSSAFYRLCLESRIDARIITRFLGSDSANNHAWNIVALGGQYYEVDATWDHNYYGKPYPNFLKGSRDWQASSHNTLGDQFADSAFAARYSLPTYNYVTYDAAQLEGQLMPDSIAAALSAANPAVERFRVSLSAERVDVPVDGVRAFEVYPTVAACSGDSVLAQAPAGNDQLVKDPHFYVTLPVPESWADRRVAMTLSSAGFKDMTALLDVVKQDGACAVELNELTHFGSVSLALLCKVTFDAENGSPVQTLEAAAGTKAEKPADPVRENHSFLGWYVPGAESPFDFDSTLITADLTLTAHWKPDTYEILFDANGGEHAPASQVKTYGVDLTLPKTKPTRANTSAGSYAVTLAANGGSGVPASLEAQRTASWSFVSWNTKREGNGTAYAPEAVYKANEAAILYAVWSSVTVTSPVQLPTPTRAGYSFLGWSTDGSEAGIVSNAYTPAGDVTLTALWSANTYTVSFESNGGSSTAPQTVTAGAPAAEPVSPVKEGFWFGGWFADSACTSFFDFANTPITGDTTVYAAWIVPDLVLPDALTAIGEEAFAGGAFRFAKLSDQTETVARCAFADCPKLAYVYIPEGIRSIDAEAFGAQAGLTVIGQAGSAAEAFAHAHAYHFIAVSP